MIVEKQEVYWKGGDMMKNKMALFVPVFIYVE